MAAATQNQKEPPQTKAPWPLFDLFLDVPHPAASPSCPPAFIIGTPDSNGQNIEQELSKSINQIGRFAFPEYDQDTSPSPPPREQAPPINRFDQYAMQPPAFQIYTFSLQLQSGMRVHGHVRRYLPCHLGSKTRYDVGRRGERALVILTRVTGADALYAAILKTVEAINSLQTAMPHFVTQDQPQKSFLHQLFQMHQRTANEYANKPPGARNAPVFLTISALEVGPTAAKTFSGVDATRYMLTPPLLLRTSMGDLVSNTGNTSILPILRCLGVAHTLRLLCALLSERRTILISASPTRLATCCKSAIAILAQGLLHWQHLYIPVLAPHLSQYLAAPYPYLIGMLASLTPRLDRTDGLGEVLIINLDRNIMETRGMSSELINDRIPDLLQNVNSDPYEKYTSYGERPPPSAPELLSQDLIEILKNDKKILYEESALASMQDTAVKATKAVKATFFKLKEKGKKYLSQKSSSYNDADPKEEEEIPEEPPEVNSMAPDYIYTEGCRNEICEEDVRVAFCSFFLSMFGNMRWYLSAHPGQTPQLDRKRFLQQKRAAGDDENSTMWPLLKNFCETQLLEEFAKWRVEDIRTRQPVTNDSPLFLQCSNYHLQHKIDFSLMSVRRVAQQVAQANPSRMLQRTNARSVAMDLTAKRGFEGDYNKALADLVEQCRESSSVLFDVMTVVWIRMRDNRGLQWRHATHSLHILKNLLFHGPLAAVAEATDGLDKIRALKYYDGHRQSSICIQIRTAASQVFNLVVDRAKLFHIRRVCINKRRTLKEQNPTMPTKDKRLWKIASVPFKSVHAAMHPNAPRAAPQTPSRHQSPVYTATPTIVALPPTAPSQHEQHQQQSAPYPSAQQQASSDLLGLQSPPPRSQPPPTATDDPFGVFGGNQHQVTSQSHSSAVNDMLGLFTDMNLAADPPPQQQQQQRQIQENVGQDVSQPQPQFPSNQQQLAAHQYTQQVNNRPRSRSPPPPQQVDRQQQRTMTALDQTASRLHSHSPVPPQERGSRQGHSPIPPYPQHSHQQNPAYGQHASIGGYHSVTPGGPHSGGYQGQPGGPPSGGYQGQLSAGPSGGYHGQLVAPSSGSYGVQGPVLGTPPAAGYQGYPGAPSSGTYQGHPGVSQPRAQQQAPGQIQSQDVYYSNQPQPNQQQYGHSPGPGGPPNNGRPFQPHMPSP